MKTKKIILILFLILSLSFILTGCSTIGELKTKTILTNYLESGEGPEMVIDQSFNKLVSEMSNSENLDLNKYDWVYNVSLKEVNIINSKADDEGSGILTAEDVVLIYNYTITGKATDSGSDINKKGQLSYTIDSLTYDDNKNVLVKITSTQADPASESPLISEFKSNNEVGFSLNAAIQEHNPDTTLGVISLGDRNFDDSNKVLDISNTDLSLDTDLTLGETNFASILVINYEELLDSKSEQTGIASMLVAVP